MQTKHLTTPRHERHSVVQQYPYVKTTSPLAMSSGGDFPLQESAIPISPLPSSAHQPSFCSIDESYKYIFLPICYSFTFIFSISLNSVVLYRSICRTKRWNASLIYMVNLATTDLMYGLSLPFLVASYTMRDCWVFGDFMCRLVRFLFYFNLYCSIFFLTCISVHRYLGICHPMKVITLETKKAVKCTCIAVWIVVFALTCPIFRFAQTGYITKTTGTNSSSSSVDNHSHEALFVNNNSSFIHLGRDVEGYENCWDDAIDKEFPDYIPYGITLHLLGFFVPFSIIAWCYSHVVLTIFRTLHSQPSSYKISKEKRCEQSNRRERRGNNNHLVPLQREEGISIFLGARSPYASRRRKSIKTIITITLLFALCFFPFHVTRTVFLLLKVAKGVPCHTMTAVSMCYKITRPLASFNAWLNALLYFLTKDKGGTQCCQPANTNVQHHHGHLFLLKMMGKVEDVDGERMEDGKNNREYKSFHGSPSYKDQGRINMT